MLYPKEQLAPARPTVAELMRSYGNHTLTFFGLLRRIYISWPLTEQGW